MVAQDDGQQPAGKEQTSSQQAKSVIQDGASPNN
eukprot:CAMPEP_0185605526 /NCGR_PEP_ID=MMETSP0436-20130131/4106_1 /TAXON_ID=626734 ORGANISM="Favella taraikaensis, Strain Fe Narragansett Bay" /NCGR_SAMPLE_ID=MMETSP0436 /ASSEMBLY_ACC=CAM_ASM_000390 /LENGTH=33 /DNA_ID= /DNA_START= /DNA_END= /DNA_ORIENTATION=